MQQKEVKQGLQGAKLVKGWRLPATAGSELDLAVARALQHLDGIGSGPAKDSMVELSRSFAALNAGIKACEKANYSLAATHVERSRESLFALAVSKQSSSTQPIARWLQGAQDALEDHAALGGKQADLPFNRLAIAANCLTEAAAQVIRAAARSAK